LKSAEQLLKLLNWSNADIDILIFVSQSRDYVLPSTAIILQEKLGISKGCLAFDVPLGCSGYTYGLSVISSMMASCKLKKGLLLAGDLSSTVVNLQGQKTFPLFGDAGTATAFEYSESSSPIYIDAGSDGSGYRSIIMERNVCADGSEQIGNLILDGPKVFEFSIGEVPQSIKRILDYSSFSPAQVDYLIMHQANRLMNETIRKKCGFTEQQTPYSLQKFGNTSSASIPLTMVTQLRDELETRRCNLLLSGFGVGLSWSSALIETSNLVIPELIQYDK
jgi:3-oxoacyl-[acyl-carrier-protein] synthase-3